MANQLFNFNWILKYCSILFCKLLNVHDQDQAHVTILIHVICECILILSKHNPLCWYLIIIYILITSPFMTLLADYPLFCTHACRYSFVTWGVYNYMDTFFIQHLHLHMHNTLICIQSIIIKLIKTNHPHCHYKKTNY